MTSIAISCGGYRAASDKTVSKKGGQLRDGQRTTGQLKARRERQQGDIASLLDSLREPPLMRGADAGETPGHDLAALCDKALEQPHIAIRDGVDFLGAELADLLAAEKLASAGAARASSAGT
jgi:hypothetical protein